MSNLVKVTVNGTTNLVSAKIYQARNGTDGSSTWGSITGTLSAQTDLQTALNAKAPLASPTFTGTVSGITASMVGLGNVNNTSDTNKPVSSAQQTALNLKADLVSPSFTTPNLGDATASTMIIGTVSLGGGVVIYTGTGEFNYTQLTTLATDTRLVSYPDAAGVVVLDTATQTLTNKTIEAPTISGATAFSSTTRPTSAGTGSPAATSLVTRDDVVADGRRWIDFTITNFTGATVTKSGGSSESATLGYTQGQSSATNGNYNGYRIGTYTAFAAGGAVGTANFSKKVIFEVATFHSHSGSTTGENRYLWPVNTSYTTGRLTAKGIGFVTVGDKIYGHTHDGTTARLTTAYVTATISVLYALRAESDGAGNVAFYVNGTHLETIAGPTGTQTNARQIALNAECVDSVSVWFAAASISLKVEI